MSRERQIEEMANILLETSRQTSTDKSKNRAYTSFDTNTIFKYGCDRLNGTTALYNAGYRKQSEVIDEFAKMLKEKMNDLCRMDYYCEPYFLVSKSFIDKIAEEMKGGGQE